MEVYPVYFVKKSLFDNRLITRESKSDNKGINLAAWSKTPEEALARYHEKEKVRLAAYKIGEQAAKKSFDAFNDELAELLKKYNAQIFWSCGEGSDTHGIYDESMSACVAGFDFEIAEGDTI